MKPLQEKIINWARDKGINNPENQQLKVIEELGEMSKELLRGDIDKFKLEAGDVGVTIIILYDLTDRKIDFELIDCFTSPDKDNISPYISKLMTCVALKSKDVFLYLNTICKAQNTTLEECLHLAYNKIKNRKGKTINGTFIKN
ncbi:MAG: hypothetical protein ACTHY1_03565 [Lactobacillus helveticus]